MVRLGQAEPLVLVVFDRVVGADLFLPFHGHAPVGDKRGQGAVNTFGSSMVTSSCSQRAVDDGDLIVLDVFVGLHGLEAIGDLRHAEAEADRTCQSTKPPCWRRWRSASQMGLYSAVSGAS
jgi:hypothetical protein